MRVSWGLSHEKLHGGSHVRSSLGFLLLEVSWGRFHAGLSCIGVSWGVIRIFIGGYSDKMYPGLSWGHTHTLSTSVNSVNFEVS